MDEVSVEDLKATIKGQTGGGLEDIRVYMGAPRYQYGQGFGNVIRGIFRSVFPVLIRAGKTLFRSSADALKDGGDIGSSFKSALKPTLRTVLKHGGKALEKVIQEQEAPPPAPPSEVPFTPEDGRNAGTALPPKPSTVTVQGGSGRYKGKRKRSHSKHKIIKSKSNFPKKLRNWNF